MKMLDVKALRTWEYTTKMGMAVPLAVAKNGSMYCWMVDADKLRKINKHSVVKAYAPAKPVPHYIDEHLARRMGKDGGAKTKPKQKKRKNWPKTLHSTGERCKDYKAYLNSVWWKYRRLNFGTKYRQQCGVCQDECVRPNLHHLSYQRVGAELDKDLVWLCEACHHAVHTEGFKGKYKRFPK